MTMTPTSTECHTLSTHRRGSLRGCRFDGASALDFAAKPPPAWSEYPLANRRKAADSSAALVPASTAVVPSKTTQLSQSPSTSEKAAVPRSGIPSATSYFAGEPLSEHDLTLMLVGSLLARGFHGSDSAVLLFYALQEAGKEREGLLILEGFRNNRSKFMQEFMG